MRHKSLKVENIILLLHIRFNVKCLIGYRLKRGRESKKENNFLITKL